MINNEKVSGGQSFLASIENVFSFAIFIKSQLSMALVSKHFAIYRYISFRFLIDVISVSTVEVIIFVNTVKQ